MARFLSEDGNAGFGVSFRRTPLSGGMQFKGDIIPMDPDVYVPYIIELKNCKKLDLKHWLPQLKKDRLESKKSYCFLIFHLPRKEDFVVLPENLYFKIFSIPEYEQDIYTVIYKKDSKVQNMIMEGENRIMYSISDSMYYILPLKDFLRIIAKDKIFLSETKKK